MASVLRQRQLILAVAFPVIAALLLNDLWNEPLYRDSPLLFWVADIACFVILPAIGVVVLGTVADVWPRDYGFRSLAPELSPGAILGLFAFIAFLFWLFYFPVRQIAYRYLWQLAGPFGYDQVIPRSGLYKLLVVTYFSVTAAFVEETFFRALPWLYLSLRYPNGRFVGAYVIITSVLFGAIHSEQGPHGVIAAFSVGVIAAFMYSKVLNVWPFVVAHFLTDIGAFS